MIQVVIVLYPGYTALDVVGPYEILARLPDVEVVFAAKEPGAILNDLGSLSITAVAPLDSITRPDVVLVGGGSGQAAAMDDRVLMDWLRAMDRGVAWMTSVCTGGLILAGAGLLDGRRAVTHWMAMGHLAELGAVPSEERVVIDGHYATAAGVSAGIDLALTLAGLMVSDEAAQKVQLVVEYAPEPPYDAGSQHTAPAALVREVQNDLADRFAPRSS